MKKKTIAITMAVFLFIHSMIHINGATDASILSDEVTDIFYARQIGESIINNLNFRDLQPNHWAREPITRLGALEIIKGYTNNSFRPNQTVTKEESLALLIRLIGREEEAILAAQQIALANPENEALINRWSKGYLQVANRLGLITGAQYNDSLNLDQASLDPNVSFIRQSPVSREQIAKWIIEAINSVNPDIEPVYTQQAIFNYSDWTNMGVEFTPYIEAVIRNQIMVGSNGRFEPKKSLTRAELAQVIKNMDSLLYKSMNLEQKAGIIGGIKDDNTMNSLTQTANRTLLVRNNEGKMEGLVFEYKRNAGLQIATKDAPVYQNGQVGSMLLLKEGEEIEYLVNSETKEILYIYSKGIQKQETVTGKLQPLTDIDKGEITIKTDAGTLFTYPMRAGLYDIENGTIRIGQVSYTNERAPVDSYVTLTLQGLIVTDIKLIGTKELKAEVSGIVKENNTDFSYITIIDWNGKEVTKKYLKNNLIVEKQNYYDEEDEIGYIDEMFPDFRFDERDSDIDAIEAGDIVHMLVDTTNADYITSISARTNYIVKHGRINKIVYKGGEGADIIITYDDSSTSTYLVEAGIPILKSGKNIGILNLVPGDVVRMLINQAVIEPGTIKETIKEIIIDEYGNQVANIYKGKLGDIIKTQRKLTIKDSYQLSSLGWGSYAPARALDFSNNDARYFQDNKQISLEYAEKYLTNPNIEAYIVTSKYYETEKVEKITFRDGRDSVLPSNNIIYSNGLDKMKLLNEIGTIGMDSGTIVIKNGRLVQPGNVFSPDYAQVILNGNARAAIINIEPEPNNDAISIFRGRIGSVDKNTSFQVQSQAILKDMEWIYSPIPRIFTINHNTRIYDENGRIPFDEFIDYSENSKVDEVFTIIAEGTDAKLLIKNPYAREGVKGQIYEINNDNIMIKDALVYSSATKKWSNLSLSNSYAGIDIDASTVIIKNNNIISPEELKIGDKIRVMTTEDLANKLLLTSERNVGGVILFVEK